MQFEIFALVHYTNGFWIHNGPEKPRHLRSAVAAKLKILIRDFIRAVRSHRQEWEITDAERTRETSIAYGRAYQDALGDLPLEYSLVNPNRSPPITGQPGALFAQSFGFPIMPRGQELLEIAIMGNESSMAYVQRQIDDILRKFRKWCRSYVDDTLATRTTSTAYA
ncbi:hypothetical protein N7524_012054 [Penicillium chrysogenum]|nr:hypothetical protein N7524_012054 [Penicillium chrysogenum]